MRCSPGALLPEESAGDGAQGGCQAHKGAVNAVTFNRDGCYCLTGGDDRRVVLWNPHKLDDNGAPAPMQVKEYAAHNYRVLDVAVAKDNASFASCGGDKAVFVWDVTSGRVTRRSCSPISLLQAPCPSSLPP